MDNLSAGNHTVTVNWVDGSASTGVTIATGDIGAGDTFNVGVVAILIIAAAGLMTVSIRNKKIEN